MSPRARRGAALALALGLTGCGPSYSTRGFDPSYPDNQRDRIADALRESAEGDPVALEPPVALLVAETPAAGFAVFELPSGRRLWSYEGPALATRPAVLPTSVVAQVGDAVVAWDRRTGAELFRAPTQGLPLLSADGDAAHTALVFSPGGLGRVASALRVVDARTGAVALRRDADVALGAATVRGALVFVPWSGQHLSLFDLRRDAELTRLRAADDLYSRAWLEERAVFFGARTVYRFGEGALAGRERGNRDALFAPRDDLPGSPPWLADGYARAALGVDARDRVRVALRPDPALPGVAPMGGAVYSVYHRVVFALDAAPPGAVRWAHTFARDLTGVTPVRAGLLCADEAGALTLLDAATGVETSRIETGFAAAQALFSAPAGYAPPRDPRSLEPSAMPAARGLLEAAASTDARLVPAHFFAVRALVATPGPEATRALLRLAGRRDAPAPIVEAAEAALGERREGTAPLLEALRERYHWARATSAPPVGAIARALAAARERSAAALLAPHLLEPATPARDLVPLATALDALDDRSALPALLEFLRLYHADEGALRDAEGRAAPDERTAAERDALREALGIAARAALRLGGEPERRWLLALSADASTPPAVRAVLDAAGLAPGPPGAPGPSAPPPEAPPVGPPARATRPLIDLAFAPVRAELLRCVDALPSRPATVRITFHYVGDGTLLRVAVTPAVLDDCVLPIVRGVRLPATQVRNDTGFYYLLGG